MEAENAKMATAAKKQKGDKNKHCTGTVGEVLQVAPSPWTSGTDGKTWCCQFSADDFLRLSKLVPLRVPGNYNIPNVILVHSIVPIVAGASKFRVRDLGASRVIEWMGLQGSVTQDSKWLNLKLLEKLEEEIANLTQQNAYLTEQNKRLVEIMVNTAPHVNEKQ